MSLVIPLTKLPLSTSGTHASVFVQICTIAALTLVVYDAALTVDREVSTVWKSKLSLSDCLYLFIRYHSIIFLILFLIQPVDLGPFPSLKGDPHFPNYNQPIHYSSQNYRSYMALGLIITMLAGEALMFIRTNALYGWSRAVVALTASLLAAETIVGLGTIVIMINAGHPGLSGSIVGDRIDIGNGRLMLMFDNQPIPEFHMSIVYLSLVTTCVYFILFTHKSIAFTKTFEPDSTWRTYIFMPFHFRRIAPILYLFLRDGTLYFFLISVALLLNLILSAENRAFAHGGLPCLIATYAITSTRIYLNLKEANNGVMNATTWSEFQELSLGNIRFAQDQEETIHTI